MSRPFRGVGGSFEGDVTLLDLGENVVGDGLHLLSTIFDGEAVDILEDYFAAFDLVAQ